MPYKVRSFTVPLNPGGAINLFGDYDRLIMRGYRDDENSTITRKWFLVGKQNGPVVKELRELSDLNDALTSFFFQSALVNDEPDVEQIVAPKP